MLDFELEAMRGPGSIPTGGNILSLDFFRVVKSLMPILPLLPILSICEKPDCVFRIQWNIGLYVYLPAVKYPECVL